VRATVLATAALPIVAILIFAGSVAAICLASGDLLGYDFRAYVGAAQHLLDGAPLYDPTATEGGPQGLFLYPPPFALASVAFVLVPLWVGIWAWVIGSVVAFLVGTALLPVRVSVRWWVILLAGLCWPFLYSLKLGQMGPILYLLFAIGWRWLDRAAVLGASIAIGAMVKVQPALLFGWCLLTGRLRALGAGLAILGVGVVLATVFAGPDSWVQFFDILRRISAPVTTPHNFTPGALAYGAGASEAVATAIELASVIAAGIVAVWAALRRDAATSYVIGVVGTQLASPVVWEHYAMILLLPVALLLERRQWWALAIPILPWLGPVAYPVVFAAGILGPLIGSRARERDGSAPTPASSPAAQPA
jgi:Glycosyltransferase family 87